jgi:hypothetical protein
MSVDRVALAVEMAEVGSQSAIQVEWQGFKRPGHGGQARRVKTAAIIAAVVVVADPWWLQEQPPYCDRSKVGW